VNIRAARRPEDTRLEDVGTLWTMRRFEHTARCALLAREGDWVLRVIVGGGTLLDERCRRGPGAFLLAEAWKDRLTKQGWRQVVPGHAVARS